VVTVFLIAQLAAVVCDTYPGPCVALDACPQFMPVEQKSAREPSETRRGLGNWVDMSHDYAPSLNPAPARQHPSLRRRLPMPAYEPPPKYSEFLQRMLVRARESLGEEFRGITADGIVRPGLFPVHKTGVSLEPILRAARDFLATLDLRQQRQVSFNIQSDVWRSWSNVHPFLMRHGLGLHELTAAQREAALALVSSALSASGFETARNVMKLNEHACELTGLTEEYSEWYYWLSILGTPSAFEPWGWQFDGHHLIINCFILGDQLVLTPQFMGSEPVFAESGHGRRCSG